MIGRMSKYLGVKSIFCVLIHRIRSPPQLIQNCGFKESWSHKVQSIVIFKYIFVRFHNIPMPSMQYS